MTYWSVKDTERCWSNVNWLAIKVEGFVKIINWAGLHSFKWRSIRNVPCVAVMSWSNEPPHDKTNKMACVPSKDSDQHGHPPSLISIRCLHEESLGSQLPIQRTAKTLIRPVGCPDWSESLLGAHTILLVLSWGASFDVTDDRAR